MHWYTDALSIALVGALFIAAGEIWQAGIAFAESRAEEKPAERETTEQPTEEEPTEQDPAEEELAEEELAEKKRSKEFTVNREHIGPLFRLLLPVFGSVILVWAAAVSWWP